MRGGACQTNSNTLRDTILGAEKGWIKNRINRQNLSNHLRNKSKSLDLLSHTFVTSYIMGGGNLETLRILMGHSDYSVTRMYLHLAAQYQIMDTDIYRLDPVFFKKTY